MVKSISGHHHKQRVYDILKRAISTRELRPGDKISERTLAERLKMSRTPVREAIHALRDEGWLIVTPWQGSIVKPVTKSEINEIMHLRMAIEPYAMELVLQYLTPKDLEHLDALIETQTNMTSQDSASTFIEVDKEFHLYLAKITKNSKIVRVMQEISDVYLRLGVEVMQLKQRYAGTLQEHQNIVQALREKDTQKAADAMRHHVRNTMEALLKCLAMAKDTTPL